MNIFQEGSTMPKAIFKRGVNRLLIWAKKNSNYRLSRHQRDHRAVAAALHLTRQLALTQSAYASNVVPSLPAHKRAMLSGILAAAESGHSAASAAEEAILLDNNQEVDELVALKRRDQIAVTGQGRVIDFRLVGRC